MITPSEKYCLRTKAKIESEQWNRQPHCECSNCDKYFLLRRLRGLLHDREAAADLVEYQR